MAMGETMSKGKSSRFAIDILHGMRAAEEKTLVKVILGTKVQKSIRLTTQNVQHRIFGCSVSRAT
jgi:hypothetical protein